MAAASLSTSDGGLEPFDPALDHFARLGLDRAWRVDRNALEDGYLDRSRRYHPDRHAGADAATRRAALEHSAALNEAYQVLRDRVRRAEYLVKLGGVDLDSSDPQTGAPHPEQSFLIEMIERRERLEAVSSGGTEALEQLRDEIEAELEQVFDAGVAALERGDTRAAAAELVHRRYLQRFNDEVGALLDELEAGSG
ncbi:Chaperone protein HscB [Enhygromyxa salina]|uniref:Co-chaperone protein HscB homolog n=1 Tax=Enhygromyxa salina TaxID=215803 RepID=A0A0C2CZ60_9BACT|nr:Chaperone protein HscB [Enhygromyxa salina]